MLEVDLKTIYTNRNGTSTKASSIIDCSKIDAEVSSLNFVLIRDEKEMIGVNSYFNQLPSSTGEDADEVFAVSSFGQSEILPAQTERQPCNTHYTDACHL